MYDTIVSVIESGHYELADMLNKIDTLWVQGDLDDEQRTYLITRANENANVDDQYKPLQEQLNKAFEQIAELAIRVAKLENAGEGGEDPDPKPEGEYPEWYAWTGIGAIPWQKDSKCTHNGEKWISMVNNNIWEPGGTGVHETIWAMVKEEEEPEEPVEPTDPEDPDTPDESDTPESEKPEEWPEFVQPANQTDAYQKGDKVTFNGKHYISLIDNNTWSPTDYPAGWQEQTEEPEPEQEV